MARVPKTLGQAEARLLADLASQDKTIFTTEDARTVSQSSNAAVDLLISRLVKKKWLIRLNRGTYLIVPLSAGEDAEYSENWFVVAKHLIEPADYYLSYFSALDIHEMTVNPVATVFISTPVRRIEKRLSGATYRFITARPQDLWGTGEIWATLSEKVKVSDLERTIVDCLNRPDLSGGIMEVARGLWMKRGEIDYAKLAEYTHMLGKKSVAKRLGFLLELFGLATPEFFSSIQELVSASYALLDPTLPAEGRYVRRWRIRVNVDPGEIKAAVTT
ncbi:MAG: type IV toxin-antitoxin system AbiEi family antitoxin domain-containing protein [Coriobacteriia bacterium]